MSHYEIISCSTFRIKIAGYTYNFGELCGITTSSKNIKANLKYLLETWDLTKHASEWNKKKHMIIFCKWRHIDRIFCYIWYMHERLWKWRLSRQFRMENGVIDVINIHTLSITYLNLFRSINFSAIGGFIDWRSDNEKLLSPSAMLYQLEKLELPDKP